MIKKKKVVFFINEWLTFVNLKGVIIALEQSKFFEIVLITDGYNTNFIIHSGLSFVESNARSVADFEKHIDNATLVIMSKTFDQESEISLMLACQGWQVPFAIYLPDLGVDPLSAKMRHCYATLQHSRFDIIFSNRQSLNALGNKLLLPDTATAICLGSPWLDQCELTRKTGDIANIIYFDCPFEFDSIRNVFPNNCYKKHIYLNDLELALSDLPSNIQIYTKLHVQSVKSDFSGFWLNNTCFLNDVLDIGADLSGRSLAISSYSNALIDSKLMGNNAISFQPWKNKVRADVFSKLVPIVETQSELIGSIQRGIILKEQENVKGLLGLVDQALEKFLAYVETKIGLRI